MPANGNTQSFPELKTYDESDFAPPPWATGPKFRYNNPDEPVKHGESSKSGTWSGSKEEYAARPATVIATLADDPIRPVLDGGRHQRQRKEPTIGADSNGKRPGETDGDGEEDDGEEEVWADAAEDLGIDEETGRFTLTALQVRPGRASSCNEQAADVGIEAPC